MQIKRCFSSEKRVTSIIVRRLTQTLKLSVITWWQPTTGAKLKRHQIMDYPAV
jgi:hypothetical protein